MLLSGAPNVRPRKRSIAVVIDASPAEDHRLDRAAGPRREGSSGSAPPGADGPPRLLLVQRPFDDEELPGTWGLPAGSFEPGESDEALVRRIGRQKLGVTLRPDRALGTGRIDRAGYTLEMTLWAASIESGTVAVPRPTGGVTQYRDWAWRPPEALAPGAEAGSLCCRLGLAWWAGPS